MLFTVSTIKDSVEGVRQFVARNLAGGVDHLVVFLDDADHGKAEELNRDAHITAVATNDEWWQGKRPERLNVRQRINANVARALLTPFGWAEWIFHIDGDESLRLDRGLLAALPEQTAVVRLRPWESVSRWSWPDDKVTHFKRMLPDAQLEMLASRGLIDEPTNGHYFHGHCDGKVGMRPAIDRWLTLHSVHDIAEERIRALTIDGKLLHFESWSGEEFVRKWVNILNSGGNVVHRPLREPTAAAMRAVIERDLPERQARQEMRRVYERTTEDDFETLLELGLLDEIDPLEAIHEPETLGDERGRQLYELFAAVRPEHKRSFHTGKTAGPMLRRLESAADRITHPGLAELAREAWQIPPAELARAGTGAGKHGKNRAAAASQSGSE